MVRLLCAITQMTDLLRLDVSDSEDEDWSMALQEVSGRAASPASTRESAQFALEHVAVGEESGGSPPGSSAASPRASRGDGVPALSHVADESPRVSPGASPRVSPTVPRKFEETFGVEALDPSDVRKAVWRTMQAHTKIQPKDLAFKTLVLDLLKKSGDIDAGRESCADLDRMIDECIGDLVADKIELEPLFISTCEIPAYLKTGVEVGDFPKLSTENMIVQLEKLGECFEKMIQIFGALNAQLPTDFSKTYAENIVECLRLLKLLSNLRVHDGISWDSPVFADLMVFLHNMSKITLMAVSNLPDSQRPEFVKLALVDHLERFFQKKLNSAVESLISWATNKIKKREADPRKEEKAEKAGRKQAKVERTSGNCVVTVQSPSQDDVDALHALHCGYSAGIGSD